MTVLEAVGDYLVAQGQGTLGTNLFLSMLPESPDFCVAILESEGGSPDYTLGTGGIRIDRPNLQILVRATRNDYKTARDKADEIRLLLSSIANQTISGVNVMRIAAMGSVGYVGEDEKSRPLVSANYQCMVRM